MTLANDAIEAADSKDSAVLKAFLVKRVIYMLEPTESPEDFVALVDGSVPQALAWNNTIFWLDASDTTSVDDGLTILRTSDDYCYKASTLDLRIKAVLDRDLTAPPTSPDPSAGDAYIVATGSSGDWAGHDDKIAFFTGIEWKFRTPQIGDWVLVEDEDLYVRWTSGGTWEIGVGSLSLDDASIQLTALIGFGLGVVKVENQTTTAEPGSPLKGTNYIIGAGATGTHWAGNDGKVAMCIADGIWKIITPVTGDRVYDKNLSIYVKYTGAAWTSDTGAIIGAARTALTTSGSETTGGSGNYTYSAVTAPTTSQAYREDSVTLAYQAKAANAVLEFDYTVIAGSNVGAFGLFRDAEANAIAWFTGLAGYNHLQFIVLAPDAASHTYKIRDVNTGAGVDTTTRRRLSVKEYA